ncbi:poly-gamma-glutamate synthesis protein (capsule biosynthesis protein) [Peribacillus deserti]|uniref:Poly-gamma-glutamate synthesis protein (Capsule biosynthesis protein) n=1 Tax=Peribacillus deserti TaxID=673318 RepID=A0ABS2QED3_9BACI|nr:CapA family protein [Peribacillus deserti]MBM7691380.1 poly-gamma-glutamate synthesis protein (capsule biosynthesis protein) [Peribacillus deserti]
MKKNYITGAIVCVFLIVLISTSILYIDKKSNRPENSSGRFTSLSTRGSSLETKNYQTSATLGAIGDVLIHDVVYKDAYRKGTYDFDKMFKPVMPYLQKPDVLVANQESMIGGEKLGLSSYPSFNSPYEVGDTLKRAGVDIVTIANNHSMDHGEKALLSAISHYNKLELPYTGAYKNWEDSKSLRIMSRNGISFVFLAYTYGLNGNVLPKDKPYIVDLFDIHSVVKDIAYAKKFADVVVVSTHWGTEYQRLPSQEQKGWAERMAEAGADVIIGHHPHVLQPIQWVKANGKQTLVIYSLGNFLSGQIRDYKDIGGILTVKVTKKVRNKSKQVSVDSFSFIPTYVTSQNRKNFRVLPLSQAEKMGLIKKPESYTETMAHMSQWAK